jgi:uncharacterized protein YjdB
MPSLSKSAVGAGTLLLALLGAHACGDGGGGSTGPSAARVAVVTVSPATVSLEMGETATLTAAMLDVDGHPLTRVATWSSSKPEVARVSNQGVVSTVAPGSATISATSEGIAGSAAVIVSVASSISPAARTIGVGDGWQFVAMRADTVLANVGWSSSNPSVATVSSTGYVTALTLGSAMITGTIGSKYTRTATVTVVDQPVSSVTVEPGEVSIRIGDSQQFATVLKDHFGHVLTGRAVTWTSSNAGVATVSGAGLATAVGPGSATITAASEGKTGTATVVVTARAVASVVVSGGLPSLPAYGSGCPDLSSDDIKVAHAYDDRGGLITGRAITWAVGPPGVLTPTSSGSVPANGVHYTAVGPGTGKVEATIDGVTGSTTVSVYRCVTIAITPNPASVVAGKTVALTATVQTPSGTLTNPSAGSWETADGGIATVNPNGVATGVKAGATTISFVYQGVREGVTLTVLAPDDAVASVTITPHEKTIEAGDRAQLDATLKNAAGDVITTKTAAWTSLDPTVAEMSASTPGLVLGRNPGTARIVASAEGRADTARVVVIAPVVARVEVTGGLPSLPAFGSGCPELSSDDIKVANAYDARGGLISGRPITWAVGPSGVLARTSSGSVPANGVHYTAIGAGTGKVEATIDGVTGFATVSVYNCITVTVTPNPASVTEGGTVRLTATVQKVGEPPVTSPSGGSWESVDWNVATVDVNGTVTGVKAGTTTVSFRYQGAVGRTTVVVGPP